MENKGNPNNPDDRSPDFNSPPRSPLWRTTAPPAPPAPPITLKFGPALTPMENPAWGRATPRPSVAHQSAPPDPPTETPRPPPRRPPWQLNFNSATRSPAW